MFASSSHTIEEPTTYAEAMRSPEADQWKVDIQKEYESLMQNSTWRLAPLPKGKKAIKCKWVYKVKYKPNGKIERFKARLVAKGYSQVGVDYSENYARVINFDSLRTIYAMVTKAQMKME